jgi:hypothetical protein
LRRGHELCSLLSIEGLRALDEDRNDDAERGMHELVDAATEAVFLSNSEIAAFPQRLERAGLFPELCSRFRQIVEERDWRNVDQPD